MKKKYYFVIGIVAVIIIGIILYFFLIPINYCQTDSDCRCCDFATAISGEYKDICINRDYVLECANTESKDAFCAKNDCKCVNSRCISVNSG
jgi:hypothetical protein